MVRSMISHVTLPYSLWRETLKTILNRVSTKAKTKIPYEIWTSKKPNINHVHIWSCLVKVRPYKENKKKLDSRTISSYFKGT